MSQFQAVFKAFDVQVAFADRLAKYHVNVRFTGVTTEAQRWEIIRRQIIKAELGDAMAGRTETFAKSFERISGKPFMTGELATA